MNSQPFWVHHNPKALSVLACDKVSAAVSEAARVGFMQNIGDLERAQGQ